MPDEPSRSRDARAAAEAALVRVVHHYGTRPEFVVIGGLVPELLCAESGYVHAGTTDVDVQVNLEIACGSVNTRKLENALRNAEFQPDADRVWRWVADTTRTKTVVKFELLADLDDQSAPSTLVFNECDNLGAANLRGTGFATRDIEIHELGARNGRHPTSRRSQHHGDRRLSAREGRRCSFSTQTKGLVRHRVRAPPQ